MTRSMLSLTYKRSISEAITEARSQKKIFLVYVSGDDENSIKLEQSTLADQRVADAILKQCIFLHLVKGTIDASNFSAIYPHESVPSISAIRCNGLMLWHHEGYFSPEIFLDSIEKAWSMLQLQEFLAAAAAPRNLDGFEHSNSSPAILGSHDEGSSSSPNIPHSLVNNSSGDPEPNASIKAETGKREPESKCGDNEIGDEAPLTPRTIEHNVSVPERGDAGHSDLCNHIVDSSLAQDDYNQKSSTINTIVEISEDTQMNFTPCLPEGSPEKISAKSVGTQHEKADDSTSSHAVKSTEVHLNIRFPNGSNLQMKVSKTDTLEMVKKYASENHISAKGSYDLAIPYPHKVFDEEDMSKPLSELGFTNREALIVIPNRLATSFKKGQQTLQRSSETPRAISNDNSEGYIGFARRILSYLNPFSYLGGSASSLASETIETRNSSQPRPNSSLQDFRSGGESSYSPHSRNMQAHPNSETITNLRNRKSKSTGSNVHTLRDIEDDGADIDKNMYWNGNSTQFGGDDKK